MSKISDRLNEKYCYKFWHLMLWTWFCIFLGRLLPDWSIWELF